MKRIALSRGYQALVDDEDLALVNAQGPWYALKPNPNSDLVYATAKSGRVLMHQVILPGCICVDHINGDSLDNRRHNLRPATHAQNLWNSDAHRDSKTGIKGVWLNKRGRYQAQIMANGQRFGLGSYSSLEEATRARRDAEEALHGEFARRQT